MNAGQDFDRRLATWLEDGTSRASERAIAAALENARTHPRRRDPLAALRRDPMGSSGGFGTGLRALPLVVVLALTLVAAFAVASVGGLFDPPALVPPPITSPSPSPLPSSSPSVAPSPSPVVIRVNLVGFGGRDLSTIEVVDESGTLIGARTGQPNDDGSASTTDRADAVNDLADPATVVLTWTGILDDTHPRLTIAPDGRMMTVERVPGVGDLLPVDRVLILTFAVDVPAEEVIATIVDVAN